MKTKYKNIKVGRFRKDKDGNPFQTVDIPENRTNYVDMYFLEGEDEPVVALDGFFTKKTLKEISIALEEFDKRSRK